MSCQPGCQVYPCNETQPLSSRVGNITWNTSTVWPVTAAPSHEHDYLPWDDEVVYCRTCGDAIRLRFREPS